MSASASGTIAVMPAADSRSMMPAAVSTASRRPRCVSTATRRASAAGWAGGGVTRHSIGRGQDEPTDAATSTGAVGARRASSTKNSRLPAGPGNRLGTTAWVCQPRAAAASTTPVTASTCSAGRSDHATVAEPLPAHLELRFDHQQQGSRRIDHRRQRRQQDDQGDEREVADDEVDRSVRPRAPAGGRGRSAARTSAPSGRTGSPRPADRARRRRRSPRGTRPAGAPG